MFLVSPVKTAISYLIKSFFFQNSIIKILTAKMGVGQGRLALPAPFFTSLLQKIFFFKARVFWDPCFEQILKYFDSSLLFFPLGICLFKVADTKTRSMREICSKLTIKTPERDHWRWCFHCWIWVSKCQLGYLIFFVIIFNK